MTERKAIFDADETPEDVATLYSWANLHGAKYRDFSASRAQTREKARERVQQAIEEERRRAREEAEAQRTFELQRSAEGQRQARELTETNTVDRADELPQPAQQRAFASPLQASHQLHYAASASHTPAAIPYPAQTPAYAPVPALREQSQTSRPWPPIDPRENTARPAWLAADRPETPQAPVQHAPEDTLQGSRDRITSRWFALKGVFSPGTPAAQEPAPAPSTSRAPVLAVFSLAGGVGKTSLVATLGRALSARAERVLLIDTASFGLLPFFFGARDQRPGMLRTFTAPGNSGDAPVQLLTVDCDNLGPENLPQEMLSQEILRNGNAASRILVDLATASGGITRRVLRMNPTVLVPVVPDMSSVVSVGAIDAFFQRNSATSGNSVMPFYVMNQFDSSLPLHLDVREVLREQLGDRLLPFSLRRTPAVSEALAEGMTVVDYAPNSTVTEDFGTLAAWVKSLAAPASSGFRGVRWSER